MSSVEVNEFKAALEAAFASFGLDPLLEVQLSRFAQHYQMLRHWNQRVNLTRIINPKDAAVLHYAESLFGARYIGTASEILDIGSGAGFPGLPMAVIRSDVHVTALEANRKKSLFLKEAKAALGLENFDVATARLEEFDWSKYELLTSRALELAEAVFQSVLEQMVRHQRLMLYCAPELANKLTQRLKRENNLETYQIPLTSSRIVAIFSPI